MLNVVPIYPTWRTTQTLKKKFKCELENENNKRKSWGTFPSLQHFRGKRGMLELRDGDKDEWQVDQLFKHTCTNQTINWLVRSWITFAWMNHGHTQTQKIHYILDLREAITFPLILFSMISHGGCTLMSFCPKIPKLGVPKFRKLGFLKLWRLVTSCANLRLKWDWKQSCGRVESFLTICGTQFIHM
jgi:hypothetical protein